MAPAPRLTTKSAYTLSAVWSWPAQPTTGGRDLPPPGRVWTSPREGSTSSTRWRPARQLGANARSALPLGPFRRAREHVQPHPKADGTNNFAHSIISNPISGLGGYTTASGNGNTGTWPVSVREVLPVCLSTLPKSALAGGFGDCQWRLGQWARPLAGRGIPEPADQGNLAARTDTDANFGYTTPYFSVHNKISGSEFDLHLASRMMPSPGMFGSLPSGIKRGA